MSPRAACRLETLGFEHVYDYVPGKVDWLAHALPREGEAADEPRAGDVACHDVVTCSLRDPVTGLRERIEASRHGFALVVADNRCLLGRIRRSMLDRDPHAPAEEVMEPGPSTVRPDAALPSLVERLGKRDLRSAIVTTPEGTLVGVLLREDAEAALERVHRAPAAPPHR